MYQGKPLFLGMLLNLSHAGWDGRGCFHSCKFTGIFASIKAEIHAACRKNKA